MKRHLSIFASFGILGCQGSAISTQTETEVRALTVEVSALKADVERLEDQVEANRISAVNWEDDVEALWSVVSENESRLDDVEATEHVTEDWVTESIVAKTGSLGELATRLDELEEASSTSETAALAEKIQVNADGDVIFRDTNVYIQNGTGSTDELNGKGNLILGYGATDGELARDGSHNMVVGDSHSYTSHSGIVSGESQQLLAPNGAVIAGIGSRAEGDYASVFGGQYNVANGSNAAIFGGAYNSSTGTNASILGGYNNNTTGIFSTAAGGRDNLVSGEYSMVAGGSMNTVDGDVSTIAGGHFLDVDEAFSVAMVDELDAIVEDLTSSMTSMEISLVAADTVQNEALSLLEAADIVLASSITAAQSTADANTEAIAPLASQVTETASGLEEIEVTLGEHETHLNNLEERVALADELLNYVSIDEREDVVVSGANLVIQNDSGLTTTANGKGNLIVGYNAYEDEDRSGSHNVIIGDHNTYTGTSGLILGSHHDLSGVESGIFGGTENILHGDQSVIVGGYTNDIESNLATAIGGAHNTVTGTYALAIGGFDNTASGDFSTAGPGRENEAAGDYSSALGGALNEVTGEAASAVGGYGQIADTEFSVGDLTILAEMVADEQRRLEYTQENVAALQDGEYELRRLTTLLSSQADEHSEAMATITADVGTHTALLLGAEATHEALAANIDTTRAELDAADAALYASVIALNETDDAFTSAHADLDSSFAALEERTHRAEEKGEIRDGRITQNESDIEAIEDALSLYTGDLDTVGGRLDDIEGDIDELQLHKIQADEFLDFVSVDEDGDVMLKGTNLHIQNGADGTEVANGKGNLVIGYNGTVDSTEDRSGSHNLVIGDLHHYTSTGGLVSGSANQITATNGIALGGTENVVSGNSGIVLGGANNASTNTNAAILGGQYITASGGWSAAVGGMYNITSGERSAAVGGHTNTAAAAQSAVIGGYSNNALEVHSTTLGGTGLTVSTAFGVEPIDSIGATVDEVEIVTSELTDGFAETVTDNTARLDDLEADFSSVETSVDTLSTSVSENADEIVVMTYDIAKNEADIGDLQDEDAELWIAIDDLNDSRVISDGLMDYVTVTPTGNIVFEDTNLVVRNASGSTDGAPDGKGNIFIGYNEIDEDSFRTGSHNVVLGMANSYSGFGGIVAGYNNVQTGDFASVLGGEGNTTTGTHSVIVAGESNRTSAQNAVVVAGSTNEVASQGSVIITGLNNQVDGVFSTIVGGNSNDATGPYSAVLGGASNVASGESAIVAGGQAGEASGRSSAVLSGMGSTASGSTSAVVAGSLNIAFAAGSAILGGYENEATGDNSSVGGGYWNTSETIGSWAAGVYITSTELYDVAY